MRTRLASLIVVKQEPLTNEYLESEQNALIGHTNYNEVDAQFYGLSDRHRDILPSSQSIGDLNNNNSNYAQPHDFIEDKKCMYWHSFLFVYNLFALRIISPVSFWIIWAFGLKNTHTHKLSAF